MDGKKRQVASPLTPTLQAFVLADHVYVDAMTGKKVIAGTFNQLYAEKFPSRLSSPTTVYLSLTNCAAAVKIRLQYVDLKDESVLLESSLVEIPYRDRLVVHEIMIDIPPLPMPHVGTYAFEVYCNEERMRSIRINVAERPTPKG